MKPSKFIKTILRQKGDLTSVGTIEILLNATVLPGIHRHHVQFNVTTFDKDDKSLGSTYWNFEVDAKDNIKGMLPMIHDQMVDCMNCAIAANLTQGSDEKLPGYEKVY